MKEMQVGKALSPDVLPQNSFIIVGQWFEKRFGI
jgi:hypothetical protein